MGNVVLMKYVHKLKSELIFSFFFFLGLATNSENFENPWNAGILNVDPGKKFLVFLKKILGKLEEYIVQFQVIWELERLISNSLFCSASKFFLWPHCFFFFMIAINSFAYAIIGSVVSLLLWILFKSHSQV